MVNWKPSEMGDQLDEEPMRWGTYEMGGPLGLADDGVTNENGGNELGDQ